MVSLEPSPEHPKEAVVNFRLAAGSAQATDHLETAEEGPPAVDDHRHLDPAMGGRGECDQELLAGLVRSESVDLEMDLPLSGLDGRQHAGEGNRPSRKEFQLVFGGHLD